jgi:hypothetical protein
MRALHSSSALACNVFEYWRGRDGSPLAAALGYLHSQQLASRLQSGAVAFRWLHAEQLLKHILGLTASGRRWELAYLWYEAPGVAGSEHVAEADEFALVTVSDGIAFRSTSYQALFSALRRRAEADETHLRYLGERYFGEQNRLDQRNALTRFTRR